MTIRTTNEIACFGKWALAMMPQTHVWFLQVVNWDNSRTKEFYKIETFLMEDAKMKKPTILYSIVVSDQYGKYINNRDVRTEFDDSYKNVYLSINPYDTSPDLIKAWLDVISTENPPDQEDW